MRYLGGKHYFPDSLFLDPAFELAHLTEGWSILRHEVSMKAFLIATQVVVALSVLNVWLLRTQTASPWRGGSARNLREEFAAYGLPSWAVSAVGAVKISCAVMLLIGLFVPALVQPAALVLSCFMLGAIAMHVRIADPVQKSLPAAALLMMALVAALVRVQ